MTQDPQFFTEAEQQATEPTDKGHPFLDNLAVRDRRIAGLRERVGELVGQINERDKRIAELEAQPAVPTQPDRMFPILRSHNYDKEPHEPHPTLIPWSVADLAYSGYSSDYSRDQSLERMAERGGFGPGEMDKYCPDWRERCNEITTLRARIAELEAEGVERRR